MFRSAVPANEFDGHTARTAGQLLVPYVTRDGLSCLPCICGVTEAAFLLLAEPVTFNTVIHFNEMYKLISNC